MPHYSACRAQCQLSRSFFLFFSSLSLSLSFCLSVSLSVCLSVCLSVYLSVYLSVCLSVCLPFSLTGSPPSLFLAILIRLTVKKQDTKRNESLLCLFNVCLTIFRPIPFLTDKARELMLPRFGCPLIVQVGSLALPRCIVGLGTHAPGRRKMSSLVETVRLVALPFRHRVILPRFLPPLLCGKLGRKYAEPRVIGRVNNLWHSKRTHHPF